MNNHSSLTKTVLFVVASAACAFGQTFAGRVGASHDGNQHDYDDIGAAAWDIGIFARAGARLVHVDYADHLADNDAGMEVRVKASAEGSAQRWYGSTSMCYDDQTNLQGAINNIAAQINASSANDRFYLICCGPMEVPWRGINASDPAKRQYCTAISHSSWNDSHTSSQMSHTWSSIQGSGVNAVHISDQNTKLNCSSASCWDWAKNSTDEKLRFMYDRMANYGVFGDISDAGMAWYIVTSLGDQGCTPAKLQAYFQGTGTLREEQAIVLTISNEPRSTVAYTLKGQRVAPAPGRALHLAKDMYLRMCNGIFEKMAIP